MESLEQLGGRRPVLTGDGAVDAAKAVVLLLHGGKANSTAATSNRQLAVARMLPISRHLVSAGSSAGLAVWRLRFRYRGWNKAAADPVEDVRWAIRDLRIRYGDIPIVLVGHSMGGRAALRAAGEEGVTAVVGLAPWLVADEPYEQLAGRRLLVIHGTMDKTTSWRESRKFVEQARPLALQAGWIGLHGSGHGLLRRARTMHRLTAGFVLHAALGAPLAGPAAQALAAGGTQIAV